MPDKSSTPTVDLLETLATTQLKEFDNSMSAARLYCKVARSKPWYQSRDKSIHVVPLDEGVPYYHFNCAAAELKALGAIQDFEYTKNDGNRFLVIELSRPSIVFGTDQK
jgi:hypothetical protein